MEHMEFQFQPGVQAAGSEQETLVGVISSGNLEVMIEYAALNGVMKISVSTAAKGFAEIWHAVLADFARRRGLGNTHVTINDAAATPAVVSLRLDQAAEEFRSSKI